MRSPRCVQNGWRAALLEAAGVAVELARAVAHQAVLINERAWFAIHLPSLPQALAARADVAVIGMIVDEVGSFERSVASRRLVEHGDVRLDALLLDEPSEVGRIAIASVGCQALGPEPEARLGALDHPPGGGHLGLPTWSPPRRRSRRDPGRSDS